MTVDDLFSPLQQLCEGVGNKILSLYKKKSLKIYKKKDATPVTEADFAAHDLIASFLSENYPFPVISEESSNNPRCLPTGTYWLIDPLDGTKNFIAGNDDFTVNIALIKNNSPCLGAVYLPTTGEFYYSDKQRGAFLFSGLGGKKKISVAKSSERNNLRIMVSRQYNNIYSKKIEKLLDSKVSFIKRGSSLKFCYIASGLADLYVRVSPTSVWDTAAGQCLVECAGGEVVTPAGASLLYDKEYLNPFFLASSKNIKNIGNIFNMHNFAEGN
jgi:3'(2'), 5'-bisphosphate nucleotidase